MNPFLIEGPACISFSGGRTSAYMLWRILEAHGGKLPEDVVVCFANTGKEEEATLRFVERCSKEWNVPIVWIEYQEEDPKFAIVDFESASRNGEPFELVIKNKNYLPNPVTRFCTTEMKIRPIAKYLFSIGLCEKKSHGETMSIVGIRADEQRRAAKFEKERTPLVAAGITKEMIGDFWSKQSFDLELPNMNGVTMHGNCDLCFLKGSDQVQALISEKPERAIWWAEQETKVQSSGLATGQGDRFRKDRPSYRKMYEYALSQQDWVGHGNDETIPCFCGD